MKLFLRTFSLLLLTMAIPALSPAQESLDPDFGSNGQLTTGFSIYNDEAYAIAVQTDGKILVAGQSENGADTDIALARYLVDGTLDTDFNTTGQVTIAVGSGDDKGLALAVQEDGKILVAGTMNNGSDMDIAVVRLSADGLPDRDFDQDGQMSIPLAGTDDSAYAVLLQKDGKIVLAGSSEGSNATHLFVARLNSDGSPDTGFGNTGIVADTNINDSAAYSAALREDGTIILAGFGDSDGQKQAALFSFLSDGKINQAFGNQGIGLLGSDSANSVFYDLTLLEDGNILAAGSIQEESYRSILLARFTASGTVDQDFNEQGTVRANLATDSVAYGLAIAADNSIYLSGSSSSSNQDKDFILLHYTASGQPVLESTEALVQTAATKSSSSETVAISPLLVVGSIDTEEVVAEEEPTFILTDFEQYDDIARAISIQKNGSILLAGTVENGKDTDFGLILFSTADLTLKRVVNGIDTSEGYYIATTPPTLVTRNSAASGGFLDSITTNPLPINGRGVCYGVTSAPGLKDVAGTDQTTTTTTDTTSTTATTTTQTVGNAALPVTVEKVYEGCTSDGSGMGEFRSDILNITPDTLYYVRAYAELSDGTVIYGNELQFETKDACFIATAAYGSPDNSNVLVLRQFRDTYLKSSALGRKLISSYYFLSPPLAQLISGHPAAQKTVRMAIAPVTTISYLSLHPGFALQLFCLLFMGLGLIQFVSSRQKK
ncbi:MAG: hypothetical protein KKA76_12375 [Proteobacteria bacterium]|nr:hypothetical protein [Pseudomonadota bacterium]